MTRLDLDPEFQAAATFCADIGLDGQFTCEWLSAGPSGVMLVRDGTAILMPRDEIDHVATQAYVSGGRLVIHSGGTTRLLACYSSARRGEAEIFARTANRVLQVPVEAVPEAEEPLIPEQTQEAIPGADVEERVLRRLYTLLPPSRWWRVPVTALALLAGAGVSVLSPLLAGHFLFDEVLAPEGRYAGMLLGTIGLILLVRLAEVGFRIIWGMTNASLIHDLEITLKRTAFASLQRLSLRFFTHRHTGELMTRLEQDASDVALLFHIIAPSALYGGVFLAGALIAMLWLDWQLAVVALLPFPILFAVFRRLMPEVSAYYERMFRAEADLRTVASDSLMGMRVVRAFGQEEHEMARFAEPNRAAAQLGNRADAMVGTTQPPMALVTELVLVGVWAAGAWMVVRGQVTVGLLITFAAYLAYLGRFFWPVGNLVSLAGDWARVSTAARRLLQLIDARPDMPVRQTRHVGRLQGHLALKQVSFSYRPGEPVLHRISLQAAPGEMIGLVGHTGAGKSTVLNLMARLYDADEGTVQLDGIDVRDLAPGDLEGQIGVVLQDTCLFLGSVADNIAYARPAADRGQIVAAAMAANAHDFIVGLPDGYDTELGPGGYSLSGGQRQRLAIARALLLDPPVLLMDEATASVDTETELRIQEAIEHVVHGRTVVVIAHRLSTLRMASRLYVLDGGRIVESGSHEQLMRNGGFYQRLVERQRAALHIIGVGE